MEKEYPYDDTKLRYDYENHYYVLTLTGARKAKDPLLVFGTQEAAEGKLEEISEQVFSWIESRVSDYSFIEYQFAKNGAYRNLVYKMLLNQYRYAVESSGSKLLHQHGVNINDSKWVDLKEIRGLRTIDGMTERLFVNCDLSGLAFYHTCIPPQIYRAGY